jgi:hypothetical protein
MKGLGGECALVRRLTFPGNGQEVVVLRKQHALQRSRAVQQRRILQAGASIFLRGQDIGPSSP